LVAPDAVYAASFMPWNSLSCNASFNKKYWEELIVYFPFTTMGVFYMTSGKKFDMYL
jgi:hypothetical protein